MSGAGGWLTAARIARLPLVLRAIRSHPPPGMAMEHASRLIWRTCGGPLDEVPKLVELAAGAQLTTVRQGRLRLTRAGQQVATQDHQQGGTLLATALMRAGYLADQIRRLLEVSDHDIQTGYLTCPRALAIDNAAQLVGLLRRFPTVTWTHHLRVPAALAAELTDVWSLLSAPAQGEDPRKALGDRGELYSYQFERLRASDSSKIRWVALDDDALGYDIEDVNVQPHRMIEVKSSSSLTVRFFLSSNEWRIAHRYRTDYEVHFWGGIDLSRPRAEEYEHLRRKGFPVVYRDLPQLLESGAVVARPSQYVIKARPA